jgi:Tol biopolymer transport system component
MMANRNTPLKTEALPDWWQRENQRRMGRLLLFLTFVLMLIGFFYYTYGMGKVGTVGVIDFDTANYIAFVRQEEDGSFGLYALRADGSNLHRLTKSTDKSTKSHPAWTVDGMHVLYASNLNDNQVTQIYILGDGDPRQLTYGKGNFGSGNKSMPIVSPDGKRAGFIVQGAVKTVNLNGTEVYQIMPQPRSDNSNSGDIGNAAQNAELTGPFLSASFAPDGIGIAGVQDISNDPLNTESEMPLGDQVVSVIINPDSKTMILEHGHEVSLCWEPNGKRLACAFTESQAVDADNTKQLISGIRIWSFDSPKPTFKNLLAGIGFSVEPKSISWSPDGTKMAFECWRLKGEGDRELRGIVVMDVLPHNDLPNGVVIPPAQADTVRYMVPATADGKPQNPQWSPDGAHLLYEFVRPNGKRDLWVINTDGTNPINLTKGHGDNTDAVWSPAKR